MNKLRRYAMPVLLISMVIVTQETATSSYQPAATIKGRIFFGEQMNNQALGPCSDIKAVAILKKTGKTISQATSGPSSGAKDGQCVFTLNNLPPYSPVELKAVYGDFASYPEKTYPPPNGKWTNPITLKPGETVVKFIEIDGKP